MFTSEDSYLEQIYNEAYSLYLQKKQACLDQSIHTPHDVVHSFHRKCYEHTHEELFHLFVSMFATADGIEDRETQSRFLYSCLALLHGCVEISDTTLWE